jgi:hypothetical protein
MSVDEKNPSAPRRGGGCSHSQDHGSAATDTASKTTTAPASVADLGDKASAARGAPKSAGKDQCH